MPLISIITICYNAENELPATMDSVTNQDFHDFEHLIIDGASADSTLRVAAQYALPQTKVFSEPDKGIYDAMNKGLAKAQGRYVLFLNAGDSFHSPHTLGLYAEASESNPDIIYGDTIIVDAKRNVLHPRHLSVPKVLTLKSFAMGMLVCHQSFMARRDITVPYDTSYRFSADYDWTVKCIKRSDPSRCINLHAVTTDYLTAGTTDKNKLKSLKERFWIMCRHYGTVPTLLRHLLFIARALKGRILSPIPLSADIRTGQGKTV